MKTIKKLLLLTLITLTHFAFAQELPADVANAIQSDDVAKLAASITKDNINACYGNYSLLSDAVRADAKKCFDLLLDKGADVNKACNGYVPPLMHAAKYGRLDMVKILVAKGADIHYKYAGEQMTNGPEKGETPLSYAQKYERDEIVDYLNSLKTKQ